MLIRVANPGDCELLTAIIAESYRDVAKRYGFTVENCPAHPSNCTVEWVRRDFVKGVIIFIAEQEGRPCGTVGLARAGDGTWHIQRLAVLPEARRQGCGRMLVEHALAVAARGGPTLAELAIIGWQDELRDWYGRLGFAVTQTRAYEHLPFPVVFMSRPVGAGPLRWLRYAWALPTTCVGLLFVPLALLTRGGLQRVGGVLEVHGGGVAWVLRNLTLLKGGASAMTLGHVVLGVDLDRLASTRAHERVHVRQAERWGPLFIPAYLLASLWALLRGRRPYLDNAFEIQARELSNRCPGH